MIKQGADAAIVRVRLQHEERELLVEVQLNRSSANRAQVNRSAVRLRELPRYFSSVLFAPEDLSLVKGDPAVRRRFLDELLVQRTPRLAGVLADYDRVLKQRNSLLKSARATRAREAGLTTLDIWDDRLIGLGSEIINERLGLIAELSGPLSAAYRAVAGDDHGPRVSPVLSILGSNAADGGGEVNGHEGLALGRGEGTSQSFRAAVAGARRKELERGITLVGPHRDDALFELNDMPAKGYASHGESWSFALALKLASAEILREHSASGDPVLILDDVFAELDKTRRRMLAEAVQHYEQVLITAAVLDDVPSELTAHTVHIHAGAVVAEDGQTP
jgi:DNA replication and repair protein RecF